jgi:predicted metal-dependent phosphoesterase TrpH
MKYCDLHTHSVYSDGTYTPAELITAAKAAGLGAIALTDHNTVAGLPPFLEAAKGSGVEAVPGVEFSTDYSDMELHILALFVKPEHYDIITRLLEDAALRKEQSNIDLVAALNRAGYQLDYAVIKAKTPNGQVNRAHIAAELTERGYTADRQEAFKKLLSPKCGYYVPPKRIGSYEAIRFIKSLGATAVLAHPFLSMKEETLRAFLPEAVECGLDGMETAYSKYSPETTALASQIAQEFGLKPSGGSDFHGGNKPDIGLGTGRGDLVIPMAWLENLRPKK